MPIFVIVAVLAAHWVSDFVMQTDFQSKNKSKRWSVLFDHVMTYLVCMLGLTIAGYGACVVLSWAHVLPPLLRYPSEGFTHPLFGWIGVNALAHFAVDAVTSRWTSRLWSQGRVHAFFVVIGLDQFIHTALLLATFPLSVLPS